MLNQPARLCNLVALLPIYTVVLLDILRTIWCMSYLGKWAAWVINHCELFHLFRVLCAIPLLSMFKDLKDWASSEVVFGHQPAGVDRYGRRALHQDHWLRTSRTDFPGSSKQQQSFTRSCIILMLSDVASHKLFGFVLFRRSMDKHCCCWTSQRYKSAWIWSWDQPSSCATTLRGSSWHFTSSLPHNWKWTWTWKHLICHKSCERRCNCPLGFSYTGYSIESCICQMEHGYFISLGEEDTQGPKPFRCI